MSLSILRTYVVSEDIHEAAGGRLEPPKRIVVACVVIRNPFAGQFQDDLRAWVNESSEPVGVHLANALLLHLPRPVEAYGKAAIVGTGGDVEVGSAIIHNLRFGNPLRDRIEATTLLPAVEKIGAPGAPFDIPMKHITDDKTRSHHQTVTVQVPGSPLADEIIVALAATDAGRPHARIGSFGELEAQVR
jgi:hypothetical protein